MSLKIEKLKEKIPVYDITVEDNHNFYANNILVHNCAEIVEVSTPDETAVCNLASIALPKFIKGRTNLKFDFERLWQVVYRTIVNLNKVIDRNFYPTEATRKSNMRHRPVGLGTQGLADLFIKLRLPYASDEAKKLNKQIFETMYHAAVTASMELAKEHGAYETFQGSPMSQGIFQFDMWNVKPSDRYDWNKLREDVIKHGVRNSLLLAQMPTASCGVVDSMIYTSTGAKSYAEIMNEQYIDWKEIEQTNEQHWIEFKNPIQVKTRFGLKTSDKIFYNGHKEIVTLELEDGTVMKYTENHKFLINRNGNEMWVEVKDLCEGDDIVTLKND